MNLRHVMFSLAARTGVLGLALGPGAALLHPGDARATVVVQSTLEQMTAGADVVARVVVTGQRVVQEAGRIVTYTTLDIRDGIKGARTGSTLEVMQVGGTIEGRSSWIVGAHHFVHGEDLVFFGVRHPRGTNLFVPWGVGVGLFAVREDIAGTEVVELIGDVALVERDVNGKPRTVVAEPRRFASYPAFRATLSGLLEGRTLPEPALRTKLSPVRQRPAPSAVTVPDMTPAVPAREQ